MSDQVLKEVERVVHQLPNAVWAAISFEEIRNKVREVVPSATEDEVDASLAVLERRGRVYLRSSQVLTERWYAPINGEIRECETCSDGLCFELVVEGRVFATARASGEVTRQIERQLGLSLDYVASELQISLARLYGEALEKVTIEDLKEDPKHSRYFVARFIFRDYHDITFGVVWYDVNRGVTGPETVPSLVRNKMRYVVHDHLVGDNPLVGQMRRAVG